jgi:hypothetical protein
LSTVRARWLRLAWALAAFVPLAVISTPILAIRIGVVFLVCSTYLWPVTMVAHWLDVLDGEPPFGVWHIVLAALYCAAIGAVFAWVLSKVFRIGAQVERRRALVLISLVWIPIGAFAGYQVFHYKGVFARSVPCPGPLYALRQHCADIRDLTVHKLEGFIDASYLATFRARPGVVRAFAATNLIPEVELARVPDTLWNQPPVWWATSRDTAARVYMTPGFSFDSREGDGDYYLLVEERESEDVFVLLHANF